MKVPNENNGEIFWIASFQKTAYKLQWSTWKYFMRHKGSARDSDGKESAHNVGDLGLIPGLERSPGAGHGNPLQYSCLENHHGQRSLAGYSPWGHKESDTSERISTCENMLTY